MRCVALFQAEDMQCWHRCEGYDTLHKSLVASNWSTIVEVGSMTWKKQPGRLPCHCMSYSVIVADYNRWVGMQTN